MIKNLFRNEPAVAIGIIVGVISAIVSAVAQARTGAGIDWLTLATLVIPILSGAAIRFGVISPATLDAAVADAKVVATTAQTINVTVPNATTAKAADTATKIANALDTPPPTA